MYLYIFRLQNYIKIGYSQNPENRLRQIRTSSPYSVAEVNRFNVGSSKLAQKAETKAHHYLEEYHKRREWFSLPEDVRMKVCTATTLEELMTYLRAVSNGEHRTDKTVFDY